jgi:hypothetical protein
MLQLVFSLTLRRAATPLDAKNPSLRFMPLLHVKIAHMNEGKQR